MHLLSFVYNEVIIGFFVYFIVVCVLWQGFENSQSSIRKATVVCLVAIYLCVGEELRPYLKELNGSKVPCHLNIHLS